MNLEIIENKILQEKLYLYRHRSGLQAYILPKKGYSKKFANFATHYGSIHNEFILPGQKETIRVPDGIAHFLEHKLFDQKDGPVMEKFTMLGANPNAYTSFNTTVYLFSTTDQFNENFKLLVHFVQNPYLTDESVEKEKGIIGQEIRMYEDDPHWRVYFNYLDALFLNHPIKIDIAGTVDSISHISKDTLYQCYNAFYHPSNMVIFVAGDVKPEEVAEMVESGVQSQEQQGEIKRIFPDEPCEINKPLVEQKLAVSMPIFQCGFKDCVNEAKGAHSQTREIMVKILLDMLIGRSSNLFTALYEEGLINSTFESDYTLEENYGFSVFGGESANPEEVKDRIIKEILQIQEQGINSEDFERTRNALKGRFIKQFNSVERLSGLFLGHYFRGANFLDLLAIYDKITLDFAQEVFSQHFNVDRMALSIIHPS